jgi:thiamine biosynthesis lipoprotein
MRALLPAVLAAAACAPPAAPPTYQRLGGEAFGTTWHVTWSGVEEGVVESAITSTLERVDARMSSWREDSELSAIRQQTGPVVVSEETFAVLRTALDLADATGGAFDPTVEPLMALWGFRGEKRATPPSDDEVAAALAQVGHWRVETFRHGGVALVDGGGTALDLSAIAKGYGVDAVSDALSRLGAADHMVEVGGEVRVAGEGPSGLWTLSVDTPDAATAPGAEAVRSLRLTNAGVATSGNYRSVYDAGGVRVFHTMDPRTGRPATSTVLSVTVVAPDCTLADGWATALMVMDPESGLAAVEARPGLHALWVVDDGGVMTTRQTSGMARVIGPPIR